MTIFEPHGVKVLTERRPCVLIVHDDRANGLSLSEALQRAGFAPVRSCLRTALGVFDTERPDLVLLDMGLLDLGLPDLGPPQVDSSNLWAGLRASAGARDVPIVMLIEHDDTSSMTRAYEAGATDILNKPIAWATLAHRVGFMLRSHDAMRSLRLSARKNRAILQALPDSIYLIDADGIIVDHIPGADDPQNESRVGQRLTHILPTHVATAARLALDSTVASGELTHEFEVGGDSDRRILEARLRPQADGTLVIVIRDATERRRAQAHLEYLAYYDELTGLPNRQLLVRDVSRAIASARRGGCLVALLYLDLDRFKRINDNLGHSVGDALLRSVARRLEHSLRASDVICAPAERQGETGQVARLGGDEFVILLPDIADDAQVTGIADRILQALGQPFDCEGHRFVVTPSIGIALYPRDGTDFEDLLVKADIAMYRAKGQGRNCHAFYGESMQVRSLERLELESALRRAFEGNEFLLHYQPKLDIGSGTVVGVEALLRWQHADRGWIGPDKFIPVAEETGMIVPLGDWVIREACRQLKAWANSDLGHLSIAVNVSVQQFEKEDFVDSVLRALWQHGVKPHQLELEITESLLMRNVDSTTAALKRLRAAGLALSIDDFGTGYSSLGYLRQFPVDALKIDRSFVENLPANSDDVAICSAIIAMARELKLKVIAEGVETVEQLGFLRTQRCDQAQGYLISKPICALDLQKLLRGGSGDRRFGRAHASVRE